MRTGARGLVLPPSPGGSKGSVGHRAGACPLLLCPPSPRKEQHCPPSPWEGSRVLVLPRRRHGWLSWAASGWVLVVELL